MPVRLEHTQQVVTGPIWTASTGGDEGGGDADSAERYGAVAMFEKVMKEAARG